jgi:hypothetical protein
MSYSNYSAKLGSIGSMAIVADSNPQPMPDENGRIGWSWTKMSAGSEKFNYYYYAGTHESVKVKDVTSLYFCGSIDKWTDATSEAPFFVIYTKMKGDGSDAGTWYHSRHAFVLHKGSQLIRAGEKCLFYCLGEPIDDLGGARKIPFKTRVDTGGYDIEDELLFVTLQSDSGADAGASVYAECLGMDMKSFSRRAGDTHIKMNLLS